MARYPAESDDWGRTLPARSTASLHPIVRPVSRLQGQARLGWTLVLESRAKRFGYGYPHPPCDFL